MIVKDWYERSGGQACSQRGSAVSNATLLGAFSRQFWSDKNGATAVEYCVIAAGIGLAVFGAVSLLGSNLKPLFLVLANEIR